MYSGVDLGIGGTGPQNVEWSGTNVPQSLLCAFVHIHNVVSEFVHYLVFVNLELRPQNLWIDTIGIKYTVR